MGNMTDPPRAPARRLAPIRWAADDGSRRILAAYARRRDKRDDVLRRALRMLADADGILDPLAPRGRLRVEPPTRRP